MTARRAVAVLGIGALAVAFLGMLLGSAPRRSGSDRTPDPTFAATLGPGQQACQGQELLPADTGALRLTIATAGGGPGPPLRAAVTDSSGALLTAGELAAGWRQGIVEIPVRHVSLARTPVQVCLSDTAPAGSSAPIMVAGDHGDPGYTLFLAGVPQPETRIRIDYMRPGSETWLELLPTLVHRFSLGKSGLVRHWAWIAVVVLMLLAVGLAMRVVLSGEQSGGEQPS